MSNKKKTREKKINILMNFRKISTHLGGYMQILSLDMFLNLMTNVCNLVEEVVADIFSLCA